VLAREIRRSGRNVNRVNGRSVPLKTMREVAQNLVDIHGQTEHLSLMRIREHVNLLDYFGDLWGARDGLAGLVDRLQSVRRELANLRRDERELAHRVDLLQYQVGEIESARLEAEEEQELVHERTRLANAEQLQTAADEAYRALYESQDESPAAVDLIQAAAQALRGLARLDPSQDGVAEAAEALGYQLEDVAETLRDYRDQVEFNPRRLSRVEDRLALIRNLQRKYGDSVDEVLAFARRARQELETIEHSEERTEELEAEESRLLAEIGRLGLALSDQRREAGKRLAAGVEAELEQLGMAGARFGVELRWRDNREGAPIDGKRVAFDRTGLDQVEFLVAPNVGEPLKPLVRIASGGETSRLMLALKTVLAQADRTPTLIFDEIDTGIGGRIGTVVGHKLWKLTVGDGGKARNHQVLCVTHLPQLASYGDLHLHVQKGLVGERTVTEVKPLEGKGREEELAAMLGVAAEQAQASARQLLAASQVGKKQEA
jgi:DNA repair protein RecN (Recombination protein N)